jgi:uncharacterized membrane protein
MSIFKSIISPTQNCDEIAVRFCKLLDIRVTETTVKKEITQHPNYPSLLSISDALRSYKVENISIKTTIDNLSTLQTPVIVQVNGKKTNYSLFGIINQFLSNNQINWYNPEKKKNELIDKSTFETLFTGYALLAETNIESGEIDYQKKRNEEKRQNIFNGVITLSIPFILFASVVYTVANKGIIQTLLPISFVIVTFIGAITSALLLLYEVDQHNPSIEKICSGGKKMNCGAILNSKASHILGVSWSVIGFTYFMGALLALLIGGLTNSNILFLVTLTNFMALPYVAFSIYYQAIVARQWCPMCLTVQVCLVLQLIVALSGSFYQYPASSFFLSLIMLITSYAFVFVSVSIMIPALQKSKEGKLYQHELARLKHSPEIFNALLEKQKKISTPTEGLGITLGNQDAKIKLIKVCNPYCGPCANAHPIIDELLEINPELQVQIIFTASGEENDSRNAPVQHLLAIANMGDSRMTKESLDNWYLSPQRDYSIFAPKYPLNEELIMQLTHVKAMHKWTENEKIAYTPTFFINNYQLPENYHVSDLKYFLSV